MKALTSQPCAHPGTFNPDKDPRVLQVRARRRGDLERLREHYLPELGKTIRLKNTDYQYRAYCTPTQWGQAQSRFMAAIEQAERQTGCRVLVSVTRRGLFSSDLNLQVTGTPAAIRIAGRIMDEVIAQ
jgi:2'-5' RNA ligase